MLRLWLCLLRDCALSVWRNAANSIRVCGSALQCSEKTKSGNGNGAWRNASNWCDVAPVGAPLFVPGRAATGLGEETGIGV